MAQKMYLAVSSTTVPIGTGNLTTYFTVSNGSPYYFRGSGSMYTSNNAGVKSTTATTTWTARYNCTLSFSYFVNSEGRSYDKFYTQINGSAELSSTGGSAKVGTQTYTLAAGDVVAFYYKKDSSGDGGTDCAIIFNIKVSGLSSSKLHASLIEKVYIGIDNVARKIVKGYIGVDGIAQQFYPSLPTGQIKTSQSTPTFTSNSHTDSYGKTWTVSADIRDAQAYLAFNRNDDDYWTGSTSGEYSLYMTVPDGCTFVPTYVHYTTRYTSWTLYGIKSNGTETQIASGGNGGTGTVDSSHDISNDDYQKEYVKFRLAIGSYNNSTAPQVKDFYLKGTYIIRS